MSHTPGPWTVEQDLVNNGDIDVHAAEMLPVAFINVREDSSDVTNVPRETALANAHLIAAAPDLLAELRGYHDRDWRTEHDGLPAHSADDALEDCAGCMVIKKAEGRHV